MHDRQSRGSGYFVFGYPKAGSVADDARKAHHLRPLVYASHIYQGAGALW